MNRTRRLLAASAAASAIILSGCGVQDSIVHLQPAPTENSEVGAPLRADAAQQIATRVLTEASAADTQEAIDTIYVGPAHRVATLRQARAGESNHPAPELVLTQQPTVLAMSRGSAWPRAILAATLDEGSSVQHLHVLVSSGATDRFKVYATAKMLPGTSVPALGDVGDGVGFEVATEEQPIAASTVVDDYAQALAFPTPAAVETVGIDDAYAQSVIRNAQAQQESLGDLGDLTQSHAPIPDSVVSMTTTDGGAVVFGQMIRTDTITLSDQAEELAIGDPVLQELSGTTVVTSEFTTRSLGNFIFVVPGGGAATLIGAEEGYLEAAGT